MRERSSKAPWPSAAGFVLAGGLSSRMGQDKALVPFCGVPLVQKALSKFKDSNIPARIAGSRSDLTAFAPQIQDTHPNSGPLGGIHSALAASQAEWNVFLPVDMPLVPAPLLAHLLQRAWLRDASVTALRLNGRLEPFPVVLHNRALHGLAHRLAAGHFACRLAWQTIPKELGETLDAAPVELLGPMEEREPPSGKLRHLFPPVYWFQSVNTPQELDRLKSLSEGRLCGLVRFPSAPISAMLS